MSPIKREWLIHGCLSLPENDRGRVSQKIKGILSKMYDGEAFRQYFLVSQDNLYWRGGFRPVKWDALYEFASKSRPDAWGGIYLVKAFSLNDCTPYLDEAMLVEVFRAMRPIRDLWRGLSSHRPSS